MRAGVTPERIMFDCDEVLWDWLMSMRQIVRGVPRAMLRRRSGHREFVVVKPGLFEMLWGMRHAAEDAGLDPRVRLWTNGYPWRLHKLAKAIPGIAELVGLSAEATRDGWAFAETVFTRMDYAQGVSTLAKTAAREDFLDRVSDAARVLLSEHLERSPVDSTLKLPELASLVGKTGFSGVEFLVDDTGRNVKRFMLSGRRAVRVLSHAPRLWGRVPNTVWRGAEDEVDALSNAVAKPIADALLELSGEPAPASRSVGSSERVEDYPYCRFHIDVPHRQIRDEWIAPMRQLKRAFGSSPPPRPR